MCVILFAPPKVKIKDEYLEEAFLNNPDGAGVMNYGQDGSVNYKKGFMKLDDLLKYWHSLDDAMPRAVHCRIATSGKVTESTCHPFPITNSFEEMGATEGTAKLGCLMHNGVLEDYTPNGGMLCSYSDSMVFNRDVLFPLTEAGAINNIGVGKLLDNLNSRFLLFLPRGNVLLFGDWLEDDEGFSASNGSYMKESTIPFYEEWANEWENEYYPRYHYEIGYELTEDEDSSEWAVYDFIADMDDFIINQNQPLDTIEQTEDGYKFTVDTYELIHEYIPKRYRVISCQYLKEPVL